MGPDKILTTRNEDGTPEKRIPARKQPKPIPNPIPKTIKEAVARIAGQMPEAYMAAFMSRKLGQSVEELDIIWNAGGRTVVVTEGKVPGKSVSTPFKSLGTIIRNEFRLNETPVKLGKHPLFINAVTTYGNMNPPEVITGPMDVSLIIVRLVRELLDKAAQDVKEASTPAPGEANE